MEYQRNMNLAIFDIDGTLTNTNGVDNECFVKALAEAHAITEIDTDWATYPHTTRESALMKLRAAKIDIDGVPAAYAEDGLSREEILQAAVSQSLEQYPLRSFGKIVSIGDGLWDVRTARRLNFTFLGVGCGKSAAMLHQAGAKHVIENFADYGQLVRFLNEAEVPTVECFR